MSKNKVQSIRLILGGDKDAACELKEGESITLGRDPGCDLRINHHSVSPIHCRLYFGEGILTVSDLESREGLFYKNRKAKRLELKEDAAFVIGEIAISTRRGFSTSLSTAKRKTPWSDFKTAPLSPESRPSIKKHGETAYRKNLKGALRKIPFIGISLFLHIIILVLIADIPFVSKKVFAVKRILAQIISTDEEVLLDKPEPEPEKRFDEPDPLDFDFFDLVEFRPDEFQEPREMVVQDPGIIAISGAGTVRDGVAGLAGEGTAELRGLMDNGFRSYIRGLRSSGMDVAFVIDSTSSMVPFIDAAKRVVNTLISRLAAIVPNLRMAIVTFRDEEDEYVTRHLELTNDRYEILNFLEDCQAGGGGDFPEAIHEALRRTVETLLWREEARKVVILIGDAPCHEEDDVKIERLLRGFRKGPNPGVVSTVYIGPVSEPPTINQKTAVDCMKRIAQIAGGEFSWMSENDKMLRHLVNIAFGSQWEKNVDRLLASVKKDRMARLVERKAKSGDRRWLLEALRKVPVRAGIVDALINTSQPEDLEVLANYLESERVPSETKWAALYVLRKVLGKPLVYDPYATPETQRKELLHIEKALSDFNHLMR